MALLIIYNTTHTPPADTVTTAEPVTSTGPVDIHLSLAPTVMLSETVLLFLLMIPLLSIYCFSPFASNTEVFCPLVKVDPSILTLPEICNVSVGSETLIPTLDSL